MGSNNYWGRMLAERTKYANNALSQLPPDELLKLIAVHSLTNAVGGAVSGGVYGGVAGAGYGSAKKRPFAGAGRGAIRGGLTGAGLLGGGAAGAIAGMATGNPMLGLAGGIGGAGLGGLAGWKGTDALIGPDLKEKHAEVELSPEGLDTAAQTVLQQGNQNLKSDALGDVGGLALLALGAGAAGRGGLELWHLLRNRKKQTRSGPTVGGLPVPGETVEIPMKQAGEGAVDFTQGNSASTKAGIPWYGPALMLTGMAGLYGGWKGTDAVLDERRKYQRERELEEARQEFHDALLAQHASPVKIPVLQRQAKTSSDNTMVKVGQNLDAVFAKFTEFFSLTEKQAGEINLANAGGAALGGYGMYAGLSGLLAGALVYDKIKKRSRGAVLEAALKRRQRRQFMQSPTQIIAMPEPVQPAPEEKVGLDFFAAAR